MEEEGEGEFKHGEGFGETLAAAVKSGEIVTNAGVGRLDEVGFPFGDDVLLGDVFEGYPIAAVGIGTNASDAGHQGFDFVVEI